MNAQALVGKVLGNCRLLKVIGRGSMGAVYLAQQTHAYDQGQVAVKVFLGASTLEPLQYMDFLVRFRHEMDAVAALDHPHILPVHDYGEYDGFIYLVMPYVAGETLRNVLTLQGMLPFPNVMHHMEQLATALDYAHQRGVIHRDIKPANILVTHDDRLVLTDFAVTKVISEEVAARVRRFTVGMLDYLSPEQVMGKEVDKRSDLYSLGAVLYHMVTGSAPFRGESLMEVAKKHLQEPPPSPGVRRVGLPITAEQVMMRALAKRPEDRYTHARDMATAFRLALATADTGRKHAQQPGATLSIGLTGAVLFDPKKRQDTAPAVKSEQASRTPSPTWSTTATASSPSPAIVATFKKHALHPEQPMEIEQSTPSLQVTGPTTPVQDTSLSLATHTSDILPPSSAEQGTSGTIVKLTGPAKIVSVPVAGQPGRYMTGLLPVLSTDRQEPSTRASTRSRLQKRLKIIGLLMVALLVFGTSTIWFAHMRSSSAGNTPKSTSVAGTPDVKATLTAQAVATVNANIILSDSLSQNIHNWPVSTSGSMTYAFVDGAYHITNNDPAREAPAMLPGLTLSGHFVYTLTMEEIKGDDTSINNEFGMIIHAGVQNNNGKAITTFYTFEILNKPGGEYQFWKYDDSQRSGANPWTELWHHAFNSEFHEGQGPKSINTFKIIADGKTFTLIVNGKQVGTVQDGSFSSGGVGMLVNLKGTEVAFSNLKLTYS